MTEIRIGARAAFLCADPEAKVQAVHALADHQADLPLHTTTLFDPAFAPGRPLRPELVLPRDVPRRSPYTPEGHAALVHSIAHIEFNAIKIVCNKDY